MSYSDYLKSTLKPLGIYELDSGLGAAELNALGGVMDSAEASLANTLKEMLPLTAENEGLTFFEGLFPGGTCAGTLSQRRAAVNIMLRLGETECSEQGLNFVLSACGIPAEVSEGDTNETVTVTFLEGAPSGDALLPLKRRIEAILPCHLAIEYE